MKKHFLLFSFLFAATLSHAQSPNRSERRPPNNGSQNGNNNPSNSNGNWQNGSNSWGNNQSNNNGWQSDPRRGRCNDNCACGGRAFYYEAMPEADFAAAIQELKAQSFDDDKLQMAKYIISSAYTSTRQVVAMSNLFSFSDGKKAFLIAAYPTCLDKNLYFQAVNTLSFSKDKSQVWAAIEEMRRQ